MPTPALTNDTGVLTVRSLTSLHYLLMSQPRRLPNSFARRAFTRAHATDDLRCRWTGQENTRASTRYARDGGKLRRWRPDAGPILRGRQRCGRSKRQRLYRRDVRRKTRAEVRIQGIWTLKHALRVPALAGQCGPEQLPAFRSSKRDRRSVDALSN